ncbi:MAG: hypothetical protein K9M10_01550 [Candidatus Pacebacteria bacterium]|nr:hypothetical protein [Candidatus Paceibacterota bacterium]MCF7857148.1 hypothetical protein [Candidatus Paceibacterota bacterium]
MKRNTKTAAYKEESRFFYFSLAFFMVAFFAYIYFLSNSVMNVVIRKEIDSEISSMSTVLGQLESKYIEMQYEVSTEIATHQGFVVSTKKTFIDRTKATLVLSKN